MKIATWNVNGIRARQAQLQEWVARERPDVVCLQEIKASPDQIPVALCEMEGYWCYWHGEKGYSGVGIQVSQAFCPDRPAFVHPARPEIFERSISAEGAASRSLMVGSSVMPPASGRL